MNRPRNPHRRLIALAAALFAAGALSVVAFVGGPASSRALGALSSPVSADAAPPESVPATGPVALGSLDITLSPKWSGLSSPLYLTNAGDGSGRIFIVEQTGRIRVVDSGGALQATPYIDLHTLVSTNGTERGLLGLAFSPNFATDRRLFVDYTDTAGNTAIARITVSSTTSLTPTWGLKKILRIKQPFANHNGGCLQFGPDGYLYIGMGDGGGSGDPGNRAQNKSVLLGKILRIDPSKSSGTALYAIPSTNPSKLTKTNALRPAPEVWALGVRNPWRFSFDTSSSALWVADVGQSKFEEVDVVTPAQAASRASKGGLNFGWHLYEGLHYYPKGNVVAASKRTTSNVWPLYNYKHPEGEAITGGYVYHGSAFPAMQGTYLFADYVDGWIAGIRTTAPDGTKLPVREEAQLATTTINPSSFGVDENQELYIVDLGGNVYQVQGNLK